MTDGTRRSFLGGALALSTAPLACSAPSSMATDHGRKAAPGVLQPGPRWTGVAGSGGAPAAQSDQPLGTLVPDERFTGGFSAVPGQWIHGEGIRITALGLPPQPAAGDAINYFKEAVFYLEGNSVTVTEWSVNPTPVRLYDGTMVPQGSIGFSVEIGAGEGAVTAGDAILYCFLRGEHGLERRIEIPLVINVDRKLDAQRRVCYVDPDGSDDADGSRAAPWRTLHHALGGKGVGDGGKLILQKAGRYVEDVNVSRTPTMNNRRAIEVVAAEGLRADQVIITRTARRLPEPRWVIQARVVHFIGITVDLGKIMLLWGPADRAIGFLGCRLVDPRGPEGDRDENGIAMGYNLAKGTPAQQDTLATGLPYNFGGFYLAECLFVNFTTEGARLYRNVVAYQATDSFAGGPGYDDVVVDGYHVTMPKQGVTRLHLRPFLEVASAARGPNGTTVLTLADAADLSEQRRGGDLRIRFLSGALAAEEEMQVLSVEPAERRIVVGGDIVRRVAAGDRVRGYAVWHADFCQQQGVQRPDQRGLRNITIFRYRASSPTSQLFLTQAPVKLEPGSRISTNGTRFQILSGSGKPNLLLDDDMLRLQAGPQSGEYRVVKSFDRATGTGILLDAFSADQHDVAVERSKSIVGFVMALSVLRKTGSGWEMGQFQDGHRNFLLTQNTFIGQPNCLTFRNKFPGHGHRNHVQLFNLISKMDADTPQIPDWGLRVQRNHFLRGVPRGRDARVMDGRPGFDANERYQPFRGQLRIGRKPLIPFDSFGNPVDENSPVGAVAV